MGVGAGSIGLRIGTAIGDGASGNGATPLGGVIGCGVGGGGTLTGTSLLITGAIGDDDSGDTTVL